MKQEEIMLSFAEITRIINKTNVELEEFVLQHKLTRGRALRKQLRELRDAANDAVKKSLEYEKTLRENKRRKNE